MAKQSGHSRRLGFPLPKLLLGIVILNAVSILPAKAEVLRNWQYDAQTRSLTLVLPNAVTPVVSVIAPNQLLLELPNTQIGNVMGQTVQDGLVESIVLEQATPETVWVVMEFVAGTVLSTAQSAVPLAETPSGEQQWQVQPALASASRVANQESSLSVDDSATSTSASSLQIPASEIAQIPDLSDLPILEPLVPLSEPVSVPSLPSAAADNESVYNESVYSESVPVEPDPVVDADSLENAPPVSAASDPLTVDPPFIEAVGANDDEPAFVEVMPDAPEAIADDPALAIPALDIPALAMPALDTVASEPETIEMAPEAATEPEPVIDNQATADPLTDRAVRHSNTDRWPEPIPFGQPLPR